MGASIDDKGAVTRLLQAASGGEDAAASQLMQHVYNELKRIAGGYLRRERSGHTLHTTDLVHEAYIKLVDQDAVSWNDRAHFFGAVARAMRQVLVDYARSRGAQKRGGDWQRTTLSGNDPGFDLSFGDLLSLDAALNRLDALNPRLRQVVEMRFFGGMTEEEIGQLLDLTTRTVQRDWAKARAWLFNELHPSDV